MGRFTSYAGPIIFLSKFIWNFNRFILVSAGYLKIPYRKVFWFSLGAAFAWPLAYMSVGYVFADQLDIFKQRIETVAVAIAGIIVLVVLFEIYIRKFIVRTFFSNGSGTSTEKESSGD